MRIIYAFLMIMIMTGCSIKQQIDEAKTMSKCEFRYGRTENMKLSDINIQNVKKVSDLSFKKAVRLASALTEKTIPLSLTLVIEGYNPNKQTAAMNKLEWICLIDETEIATGTLDERIEILPDSAAEIPVRINADLKKLFNAESKDSFLNIVFNLIGKDREPVRLKLKIKPVIMIGSWAMDYPGYITVEKEFTSEDGKKIRKKIREEITE